MAVPARNSLPATPQPDEMEQEIANAIDSGLDWFAKRQHDEGYWAGRLQTNSSMEAEWILALGFLGLEDHPIRQRLANAILREQRADGAWEVFHDAPAGDVNATVESYCALRSMGMDPDAESLAKARAWILERNGLRNIRVFTRYWLALIGFWPWEKTPNVPPEIVLFPNWFTFSIYNFACWARATLLPITLLSANRSVRPLPPELQPEELFPDGRANFRFDLAPKASPDLYDRFFLFADKVLHRIQAMGLTPLRAGAKTKAVEWIVRHQDADGAWGGIQPPWIYSLMALHTEGYGTNHPVIAKGVGALDDPRWRIDIDEATYIQACVSPVWDTVLGLLAIQDCDAEEEIGARTWAAYDWVLGKQSDTVGDWAVKAPNVAPGGWAFEYENAHYPDVDDTAVALVVLASLRERPGWQAKGLEDSIQRAVDWMLALQCKNGGWAAFDKDNDKALLTKIPFADFGEVLDPPSVDVTAHVIEAMGRLGYDATHPAIARGLKFLREEQEKDGSWFGRWGVNFIYGTAAVLPALEAIGEPMDQPYIVQALDFILSRQQANGGWGESCSSYMDPRMSGRGEATASQTAWALMALVAAGRPEDREAIERGAAFLTRAQEAGTWEEPEYTGTGFPGYGVGLRIKLDDPKLQERLKQGPELSRAFMLNYHLYRHYFPLMALGRVRKFLAKS
ncbi:MAG: squalene--hopene cyclase [Opitutales bacterium]